MCERLHAQIGELRERLAGLQRVYGHAIELSEWSGQPLMSLTELRHVHELTMTPVWNVSPSPCASERERPGSFREHDIRPFRGGMTPPAWPEVPELMDSWISDTQLLVDTDESALPEAFASVFARFLQIHPFLDGNGRTGRLVLNLLLVRLGYPPAIMYKDNRSRYLATLRRADQGDPEPLAQFLTRAMLDNFYKFIVPAVAGPATLVPLPALATPKISADALRVAAIRGRLKAARAADGTWRTSNAWVDEYSAARYKRG